MNGVWGSGPRKPFYPKPYLTLARSILAMTQRQIILALHFDQPAGGAFEFEASVAGFVEVFGRGVGGNEEFDFVFVERVDQGDEARGFVAVFGTHAGDADQDHRVIGVGDGDVVAGATGFAA